MRKRGQQQVQWANYMPSRETLQQMLLMLLGLVLVAGLAHGYQWMMREDTLPFRQVTVSGEFHYLDAEELRGKIAVNVTGGFFSLDLKQVQAVLEEMPWVHRVALRRDWPDRLRVHVEEQSPIASWQSSKYLNRYGKVFAPTSEVAPVLDLPAIRGENGREIALLEDFIRYSKMLDSVGLKVSAIEEDARHDQHLLLGDGMQLVLGREDRDIRLKRFVNIYARTLSPVANKIASLDLRYSNGFSVRWHEPEVVNPKKGNDHA